MRLNIDAVKLSRLVKSFYELTKIRMVVFDNNFNEVFCYPEKHSVFCDMMNRVPEIHQKCNACAKTMCEVCRDKKKMITFTCHAGLTEAVAPLCEGSVTIGYIMFGQITNIKNKDVFFERVSERCKSYKLNTEEFAEKVRTVRYKTDEQIEAVSEIMNAFTSYIYFQKIVSMKEEEQLAMILDYIDKNICSDLSVRAVCEKTSISKTVLYDITKDAMPGGIAKYIKIKRMERAKELLVSTDLTVEEISGEVGYLDSNYFRRLFKASVGQSAKAYRKSRRES